jgi:hypothetical protein
MNQDALIQLARLVEKRFPTKNEIQAQQGAINGVIKFCATHMPLVSPSSPLEEFVVMDDLQKSLRQINQLEIFLDELQAAVYETR